MEDDLKQLIEELEAAIQQSVSSSERIAQAIGDLKAEGYDIFLLLNAIVTIKQHEPRPTSEPAPAGPVELRLNRKDLKFLKALHIVPRGRKANCHRRQAHTAGGVSK